MKWMSLRLAAFLVMVAPCTLLADIDWSARSYEITCQRTGASGAYGFVEIPPGGKGWYSRTWGLVVFSMYWQSASNRWEIWDNGPSRVYYQVSGTEPQSGTWIDSLGNPEQLTVVPMTMESATRHRTDEKHASTTEPINVLSGGMYREETDLVIPAAGFDLRWGRFYNSASPRTNGILGPRWTHTYDWTVSETTLVSVVAGITNTHAGLTVRMEGAEKDLLPDGTNAVWTSGRESPMTVRREGSGEYTMTLPGGVTATFETNGLLKGMADGWAMRLSFAYTNLGTALALSSVTHADGRALHLTYANGLLAGVIGPTTNFGMSYAYNAAGELTNAVRRLTTGDFATSYGYDTNGTVRGHYLVRRVNAAGDVTSCGYSTNALGATQAGCTGLVVGSSYYGHSVAYNTNNASATVTYRNTSTNSSYLYSFDADRVRQISGPGGTGLAHRFDYDKSRLTLTNETWAQSLAVAAMVSRTVSNQPGWFAAASGMALDSTRRLCVADSGASLLHRYDPASNTWTFIAGPASGFGSGGPQDVALDSQDNLYVTDPNKHRVLKRTPAGLWTSLSGYDGSDGTLLPWAIAIDPSDNMYVGDWGLSKGVRRKNASGSSWQTIIGSGTTNGSVHYPNDLVVMGTNVLCVTDSYRLQTFQTNGVWLDTVGDSGDAVAAVDTVIYEGTTEGLFYGGKGQWVPLMQNKPVESLAYDSQGILYAADGNHRVWALPTEDGFTFIANGADGTTNAEDTVAIRTKFNDQLLATNVAALCNGNTRSTWSLGWNSDWKMPSSAKDAEGHAIEWDYTNGLVAAERIYPATNNPAETRYAYTSNGCLVAVTNANGHFVNFQYNGYGYPTSSIPQAGPTNSLLWDSLGHLKEIRLPSHENTTNDPPEMVPRVISLDPDELGRVRTITWPDGSIERFAHDASGNVTNHIDRAGRTNVFTWYPTAKLATATRYLPSGPSNCEATVRVQYDSQFNLVNVQDELGRAVEWYDLDLQGRPVVVNNYMEGQQTLISWGLGDQVKAVKRPDGTIAAFAYGDAGRLSDAYYPDDTVTYGWLNNGLLASVSNCAGALSFGYDGAHRIVSAGTAYPAGAKTLTYGLDLVGNVTNAALSNTSYAVRQSFDAAERVATVSAPSVGASFAYDSANGLVAAVALSNGMTCSYAYDKMDKVKSIVWRNASNAVLRSFAYGYTSADMIESVDMEDGSRTEYSYDTLDRLTREKRLDPYGQALSHDTYAHDLAGNRTNKTILDSQSNALMTVGYSIGTEPHEFWTGNRLASWSVAETDLCGRVDLAGYASEPIRVDDRWGYLWISNGVSGKLKPEVDGTNFWSYGLTVGLGTQKVVAAIRDEAGNTTYATNTFRLSVVTNGTYQYNAAGCLTNISYKGKSYSQTLALAWDGQYQLTAVMTNGSTLEAYGYDALGRRAWTASGGVTNWHVYDGVQVIADLSSAGAIIRSYIWGPGIDNLIALTTCGATTNTYYAIKDHLNSVQALVDSTGAIVESYRYDAWGRVLGVYNASGAILSSSALTNRYLWQGREYSWRSGLYYFRARWYEPVTGRFLSNDPIGISGGLNQYVFCGNNPVNFRDPLGLCKDVSSVDEMRRHYGYAQTQPWWDLWNRYFDYPQDIKQYNEALAKRGIPPEKTYYDLYTGHRLAPDQMGNQDVGYTAYRSLGLTGAFALSILGEIGWPNLSHPVSGAAGSFHDNAAGIAQGAIDEFNKSGGIKIAPGISLPLR